MNTSIFPRHLAEAQNLVFFTGAGVSTPSGLRDFRGKNGLESMGIDLEKALSRTSLFCNPDKFWALWHNHLDAPDDLKPNLVHETIALLGQIKNVTVVTQNIDGLHEQAGHAEVLAIHGTNKIVCTRCKQETTDYPRHKTETCWGRTRPDAVLYEERLDPALLDRAGDAIINSDMMVVLGTSLRVFPAAHLVNLHEKNRLYYINDQEPSMDGVYMPMRVILSDLEEFFAPLNAMLASAIRGSSAHGVQDSGASN